MDFLTVWSVLCKFSDVSIEVMSPSLLVKCSLRKLKCGTRVKVFSHTEVLWESGLATGHVYFI